MSEDEGAVPPQMACADRQAKGKMSRPERHKDIDARGSGLFNKYIL